MAIKYQKKAIVLNFDKKKPKKYVASNVLMGSISFDKLCNEVNQKSGVHRGMVGLVLKGLIDAMGSFLEEGFSVKLGEFGSFRPTINAKSQNSEKEVSASTIVRKKIAFTPGTRFKKMLSEAGIENFMDEGKGANGKPGDKDPKEKPGGEAPDPAA